MLREVRQPVDDVQHVEVFEPHVSKLQILPHSFDVLHLIHPVQLVIFPLNLDSEKNKSEVFFVIKSTKTFSLNGTDKKLFNFLKFFYLLLSECYKGY